VKPRPPPATRLVDDALRLRALDVLGPLGDALAREALATGGVAIEHDVIAWQGTRGPMHGHRVVVMTSDALHAQLETSHAAKDALAAALAAAMAERAGHAVADVRIEIGHVARPSLGPYRDPRP
jgi:2-keto-3-deoxy-galactonokinase